MGAISTTHRARFDNLTAIRVALGTKAELAALLSKSPSQLHSILGVIGCPGPEETQKRIGERQARDIETRLGIPQGVLDAPGGVTHHLADLLSRVQAGGGLAIAANHPNSGSSTHSFVARAQREPLSNLQLATLEALSSAMVGGRLTERDCLELLDRWTAAPPAAA